MSLERFLLAGIIILWCLFALWALATWS